MLNPERIATGLGREMKLLDDLVPQIQEAGDLAAQTEAEFKMAYAQARLSVQALSKEKLTVGDIEARAEELVNGKRLAYLIAQNRLTTTREALRAAQSRLDAWRTLGASIRANGA